jgi:hypothetical protein
MNCDTLAGIFLTIAAIAGVWWICRAIFRNIDWDNEFTGGAPQRRFRHVAKPEILESPGERVSFMEARYLRTDLASNSMTLGDISMSESSPWSILTRGRAFSRPFGGMWSGRTARSFAFSTRRGRWRSARGQVAQARGRVRYRHRRRANARGVYGAGRRARRPLVKKPI